MKNSRSSFYLAIALLGYASAGVAVEKNPRFTFKTYDVPGQLQTWLTGINNDGTIVGWTTDKQANAHAFMVIGGKYRRLLKKIDVKDDRAGYTDFADYGYCDCPTYAGRDDLPAGYWVYVYPSWYIWGESRK